ncbi:MAG: DUF2442 domain-containing protein [Terriglobales bacterium]
MRKAAHKVLTTDAQIDAALHRAKQFEAYDRRAIEASYDRRGDRVCLGLADGVTVSIPRQYLQGLERAAPSQLSRIEIVGSGTGLHWPELGVDHYVHGLLNRVFGTQQWMAQLGRLGGKSRSAAKARAARANGQLGGRPRKKFSAKRAAVPRKKSA